MEVILFLINPAKNVPIAEKMIRTELILVAIAAGRVLYDSISITGVIIFIPLSTAIRRIHTITYRPSTKAQSISHFNREDTSWAIYS